MFLVSEVPLYLLLFFILSILELSDSEVYAPQIHARVMSLKYEPASEPLQVPGDEGTT